MSTLSVTIITKNEAKNIKKCLESVKFADEIVIIDSGSSDDTLKIAKEYTDNIHQHPWQGYGAQKNLALSKASGDWLLSIDADEVVTPQLQQEILQLLATASEYDAYYIPRLSTYCSKAIRYGDWRNDYCLRLFKRNLGKFKELPVHEELIVNGKKGYCQHQLQHHSFTDLEDVLDKVNRYSSLSAQHKFENGKKSSLSTAILHGLWTFIRGYIFRLGFLDGKKGFMLAFSNAEGCYYRYLKIMLLEECSTLDK